MYNVQAALFVLFASCLGTVSHLFAHSTILLTSFLLRAQSANITVIAYRGGQCDGTAGTPFTIPNNSCLSDLRQSTCCFFRDIFLCCDNISENRKFFVFWSVLTSEMQAFSTRARKPTLPYKNILVQNCFGIYSASLIQTARFPAYFIFIHLCQFTHWWDHVDFNFIIGNLLDKLGEVKNKTNNITVSSRIRHDNCK